MNAAHESLSRREFRGGLTVTTAAGSLPTRVTLGPLVSGGEPA
jgi:hypothetical protein